MYEDLGADDSASIALAQNLFRDQSTQAGLVAIATNFSVIPTTITALEEHGLSLEEFPTLVVNLKEKLGQLPSQLQSIRTKFDRVLEAETVFSQPCRMRSLHRGEPQGDFLPHTEDLAAFKHAPIVSCEVGRTFSQYEDIFRDTRQSFIFDNRKKYVIVASNPKSDQISEESQ